MKIELDGVMLSETQEEPSGGITDGKNVTNLNVTNKRNSIPHDLPGMMGSAFQDLGRAAVVISFDGIISGANAKSTVESLRGKFQKGESVPFNSDLSGTSDITKVLIDDFNLLDTAGSKDRYNYSIVLKEYKEPPPKSVTPASLEGMARTMGGWHGGRYRSGGKGRSIRLCRVTARRYSTGLRRKGVRCRRKRGQVGSKGQDQFVILKGAGHMLKPAYNVKIGSESFDSTNNARCGEHQSGLRHQHTAGCF